MLRDPERIEGDWYDGGSSRRQPAQLRVDALGQVSVLVGATVIQHCRFETLEVSARLGSTPRRLCFGDGGCFETRDNDAVDRWLQRWQPSRWDWVHRLETHWHYVLVSLLLVVAVSVWVLIRGVPMLAEQVAGMLPEKVATHLGESALEQLDTMLFEPSRLDEAEQARLQSAFQSVLDDWPELSLRVVFRDGGPVGPNAFALPDGTLVFTDQIVALAGHDDELLAVLAHEVGHVVEKHSMKLLARNALLGFLLIAVSGDATVGSDLLLAAPLLLLEMSHSRRYEAQADDHALAWLREQGRDPGHFVNLMSRLVHSQQCGEIDAQDSTSPAQAGDDPAAPSEADSEARAQTDHQVAEESEDSPEFYLQTIDCYRRLAQEFPRATDLPDQPDDESHWTGYLSTHPPSRGRLQKFSH
jgi:Zn-dependent protease with chaperone function